MRELELALKALSHLEFESLLLNLLRAQNRESEISKIDGSGGDDGIDIFEGVISGKHSIWQCKHFTERIRSSQKKKIISSLKEAFKKRTPESWTLCIPIDLTIDERKWFETALPLHAPDCKIGLMQGSEIICTLTQYPAIRDAFFPNIAIVSALRARDIALNIDQATDSQKMIVTEEYAERFLSSLSELDPRLDPIIAIGAGGSVQMYREKQHPVLSITRGGSTVSLFARDHVEYNKNPMTFSMALSEEYSSLINKALDFGTPLTLPAGAILKIDSSHPVLQNLFDKKDLPGVRIDMEPSTESSIIATRIDVSTDEGTVSLPYMPLKVVNRGRKIIKIKSYSKLPIEITICLRLDNGQASEINIKPLLEDANVVDLNKVLNFLRALGKAKDLRVFTLEPESQILSGFGNVRNNLNFGDELYQLVSDLSKISNFFDIQLNLPREISYDEKVSILLLRRIATGELFDGVDFGVEVLKTKEMEDQMQTMLSNDKPFKIKFDDYNKLRTVALFGRIVEVGPVNLTIDKCMVDGSEEALIKFSDTKYGALFTWKAKYFGARFTSVPNLSREPDVESNNGQSIR